MKYLISIVSILFSISLLGQSTNEMITGNVSFVSSQNLYVQFVNTDGIHVGDSLFQFQINKYVPVLIVKNLSSISCLCTSINNNKLFVTNQVIAIKKIDSPAIDVITQTSKEAISVNDLVLKNTLKSTVIEKPKTTINGRVSVSSYLNNTSDSTINSVYKYNLSFDAKHISNSKFSAECYISMTNKNGYRPMNKVVIDTINIDTTNTLVNTKLPSTWELRIYDLSVKYDFNTSTNISLGRKINSNLANIGSVDGIQFESTRKYISFGAIAGFRPDNENYGLNTKLLQFGAFVGHHSTNIQASLAFFNQLNNMQTDRRFVYLQHTNNLGKNLNFFGSAEIDLYGLANNKLTSKIDLTSTYFSLRYNPWSKLSMSLSYDARKNVYYYETYKNYVDSIWDKETRQGMKFQTNYRLFKTLVWGANAGYRFPTSRNEYSSNGYTYLTYSQVPLIDASFTMDATILKSNFVSGVIYGANLSRDFLNGKVYIETSYRNVNYSFSTGGTLKQNIGDIQLSWRIARKLILSADLEATLDTNKNLDGRLFLNISQRF